MIKSLGVSRVPLLDKKIIMLSSRKTKLKRQFGEEKRCCDKQGPSCLFKVVLALGPLGEL